MSGSQIRFNDGAAYETMMGTWSRFVGDIFLDWVAPRPGLRWIDVGCGNGAFTARLIQRCGPIEVDGVDPSNEQLAFARTRDDARLARFHLGDAMALPFPDDRFDAAAMALVIFFVPEPAKGVAEMVRVTVPGGTIAAYAWDVVDGGAPLQPFWEGMREIGVSPPLPPRADAARMDALRALWTDAGLVDVATRDIAVSRTYANFDDFWTTTTAMARKTTMANMSESDVERLRTVMRERNPAAADGTIVCRAWANAVKGRVPD